MTDSRAFLPKPVNGKDVSDEYSVEHLRGPNGQEYVVYYLPYGQPLPVPVRKRRDTGAVSYRRPVDGQRRRRRNQRGQRRVASSYAGLESASPVSD